MIVIKSKLLILIFVFCLIFKCASARHSSIENTYAIVIGISGYQDASIPQLSYADKDAKLFAEWLQSKPGGNITLNNIKLLTNENASVSAVYNTLDWVKEKAKPGDIVYIYFSGHGDVETKDSTSQGYLLAWNSPPNNYRNNALSVSDLNTIANTLTTQNNAKVILITDACHSGKLAGDFFKGKQFTAHNLNKVLNNQVRLASCKENEEAAEGPAWGGGRGVFSYYLLMGLNGKAAENDVVKVQDLQTFIDSAFKNDQELKLKSHQQNPVIDGNPTFQLATVESVTFHAINNSTKVIESKPANGLQSLKSVGLRPMDYFFAIAKQSTLDDILNFKSYLAISPDDVPLKIVSDCIEKLSFAKPDTIDNLNALKNQLENNAYSRTLFIDRFVQLIQDKAQDMINAYLKGDISELEKRQYYYSGSRNYRNFLPMLKTAIHLTPKSNYLHDILQINETYLAGVIDRLEIATNKEETDRLLKSAFAHEFQAIQLEPYAAYIHNELGNLYFLKKQYDSASYHFNFASLLSPTWAIPWGNKIMLNLALNNLPKAKEAIVVADSLQPNLAYIDVNAGLVMEKDLNLLAAESYYLQAIAQNNVHYLPFERLGQIYIQTSNYTKADSFLYEASQRKDKFAVNDSVFKDGIGLNSGPLSIPKALRSECTISYDSAVAGWETYILLASGILKISDSSKQQKQLGEQELIEALVRLQNIPLTSHYLGEKYFKEGNWQQAEIHLKNACANYLPSNQLKSFLINALVDSLIENSAKRDISKLSKLQLEQETNRLTEESKQIVESSCLLNILIYSNYDELEDYYMLGAIYERQSFMDEAIKEYEIIARIENTRQMDQARLKGYVDPDTYLEINSETKKKYRSARDILFLKYSIPIKMGGAIKASKLYEQEGKYENAEQILLQQVEQNRAAGYARQDQMNKNSFVFFNRLTTNYYWLDINKRLEMETYNFYESMVARFPRDDYWYKKAGLFLYNRLALSYYQMPFDKRNVFYSYSLEKAYPFSGSSEVEYGYLKYDSAGYKMIKNSFFLPSTQEEIKIQIATFNPVKTANYYLQQAIKFSGDLNPNPALLEPIADLQSWMNIKDSAVSSYEYLLQLQPRNATLRNKLIDNLVFNTKYPQACAQLDSLYKRQQIRHAQLLQLADYYILSNENGYASEILKDYVPLNKEEKNQKIALFVKQYMLLAQYKNALKVINDISISAPKAKNTDIFGNDYRKQKQAYMKPIYTQARAYGLLGKNKEAFAILKNLIDSGFNYQYILKADPAWNKLRNTKKWNTITHALPLNDGYNEGKYQESELQSLIRLCIPNINNIVK